MSPKDDIITMLLDAEVDGEKLTHDQVEDILFLFFIAGLDTVTSSLDCMHQLPRRSTPSTASNSSTTRR